jgi:alginate O-acetyltransferase complex protein AlgI
VFRIGLTFVLVLFSWVLFRSDRLSDAMAYLGAMFGTAKGCGQSILLAGELYTPGRLAQIGLCAILAFGPIQAIDWVNRLTWVRVVFLIVLFGAGLATMFTQAFNPFLYFQF